MDNFDFNIDSGNENSDNTISFLKKMILISGIFVMGCVFILNNLSFKIGISIEDTLLSSLPFIVAGLVGLILPISTLPFVSIPPIVWAFYLAFTDGELLSLFFSLVFFIGVFAYLKSSLITENKDDDSDRENESNNFINYLFIASGIIGTLMFSELNFDRLIIATFLFVMMNFSAVLLSSIHILGEEEGETLSYLFLSGTIVMFLAIVCEINFWTSLPILLIVSCISSSIMKDDLKILSFFSEEDVKEYPDEIMPSE